MHDLCKEGALRQDANHTPTSQRRAQSQFSTSNVQACRCHVFPHSTSVAVLHLRMYVSAGRSYQQLRCTDVCRQGHRSSSSNPATTVSQQQPSALHPVPSPNSDPPPRSNSSSRQGHTQQPTFHPQGMFSSRRLQHSSGRRRVGRVLAAAAVWAAVLSCPLACTL